MRFARASVLLALVGFGSAGPGVHVEDDRTRGSQEQYRGAEGQGAESSGVEDGDAADVGGEGAEPVGVVAPGLGVVVAVADEAAEVL